MFEECSCKYDNTCGSISNFIVLTLGELDQKTSNWVLDLHFLDDGSAVIGDSDFLVRRNQQFIKSLGSE